MGALNGKPVGRPPHKNSKEAPPVDGDGDAPYSRERLIKMNERFSQRMQRAIERGKEKPPVDPVRAS
jgi:hypothetical protein